MRRIASYPVALFLILAGCAQTFSEEKVIRCPNPNISLEARRAWAQGEAKAKGMSDGYWIGYSIQRPMEKNSFIGSFYSDRRRSRPSLAEVIAGTSLDEIDQPRQQTHGDFTMNDGYMTVDGKKKEQIVMKEVGILIHYKKEIEEVVVSNLSLRVKLGGDPLFWLEGVENVESVAFLKSLFEKHQHSEVKEKLITAAGIHPADVSYTFLKNVLTGAEPGDVRQEAAFWISQATQSDEAVTLLTERAQSDTSDDVREKCLFALSEMETEHATEALITIARAHINEDVRKKAMFWLGQKASEKAVATLKELVDDKDTEVQKNALFALMQLPNNNGLTDLIRIAKSHRNPVVRKEAIFWLGQSDDERALDALVEIARN